jgi:hypothetical protein
MTRIPSCGTRIHYTQCEHRPRQSLGRAGYDPAMHLVAVAWIYVVVMAALAEAVSPTGSVLGAVITFLLYGLLPLSIVLYILNTPARRAARRAAEAAQGAQGTEVVDAAAAAAEPRTRDQA